MFSLPKDMQARFLRISELLETFGPQRVGLPHARPLGEKLWEMRLTGKDGIGRVIYTAASGRRLMVLHAFLKKTQKTQKTRHRNSASAQQGDRVVKKRLHSIKTKMLSDRAVRTAYDALAAEFNLAHELIGARVRAGLTQTELADRMGTTQSAIARLERGAQMPSVNTLLKFAKATHSRPVIKLQAA